MRPSEPLGRIPRQSPAASTARTYSWVGVWAAAGWSSGDVSEKENFVIKSIFITMNMLIGEKIEVPAQGERTPRNW